jgi:hypothetical protein
MSHLRKLTCKGTLRQAFIRYGLEIQSVILVFFFSTQLVKCCPFPLLSGSTRRKWRHFALPFMSLIFLRLGISKMRRKHRSYKKYTVLEEDNKFSCCLLTGSPSLPQSTYRGRGEIKGVYLPSQLEIRGVCLPSQLERTPKLCLWW